MDEPELHPNEWGERSPCHGAFAAWLDHATLRILLDDGRATRTPLEKGLRTMGVRISFVGFLLLTAALVACSSSDSSGASSSGEDGDVLPGPSEGRPAGSLPAGECTGGRHCNVPELHTCFQWKTSDAKVNQEHEDLCTGYGGTAGDDACPTANVVSGCKTGVGTDGCAVNWGYSPAIDDDDVRKDCERQKGEFIDK